ncbi:MAG: hypothetical protein RIS44_3041 [Pseudomonadota bacterium]|jgi:general secretion pathway protein J
MKPDLLNRSSARGFTLLELLVVMTMISLIALAMVGAMRTMAQTESRVSDRLQRVDEYRSVSAFLQSILGRISSRKLNPAPPAGANLHMFSVEPDAVNWVGAMPARHGAGGMTIFRLAAEAHAGESALVLRFAPLNDKTQYPDWKDAEQRVLVPQLTSLSLSFMDGRDGAAQWQQAWSVSDRLPSRIRIAVQTKAGAWPELIIPLRVVGVDGEDTNGYSAGPR